MTKHISDTRLKIGPMNGMPPSSAQTAYVMPTLEPNDSPSVPQPRSSNSFRSELAMRRGAEIQYRAEVAKLESRIEILTQELASASRRAAIACALDAIARHERDAKGDENDRKSAIHGRNLH